jgi:mRNA interferase RelE/StbE
VAAYRVIIPRAVQKALDRIHPDMQRRIRARLLALAENPRPPGVVELGGPDELYRVRIGTYRALYTIEDRALLVLVVHVAHRSEAYE